MGGMTGSKEWAVSIERRCAAGELIARLAVDWASEVLGRPILRGGKHAARPDTKDLQAGDLHDLHDDRYVTI